MNKVTLKDFRAVKEIVLPQTGLVLECYSSVLVKDLAEIKTGGEDFTNGIEVIMKSVKSWNMFASESDEQPLPITMEHFMKIPAPDFQYLTLELKKFADEQKKS